MAYKDSCPYCDKSITSTHFFEHLSIYHEEEMFDSKKNTNYQRLHKSVGKPLKLLFDTKKGDPYYACLGCLRCVRKIGSAERHFPSCAERHNTKLKELIEKYKLGPLSEDQIQVCIPSAPIVVEGYTEEKVFALLGSVLAYIHNCERELYEYKTKYEYLEEKIKDVCNEEVQEDIEESLPEYPEDEDVDFCKPEDITQLFNISQKIGIRIHNDTIKDAYEKWSKAPLKKKKC